MILEPRAESDTDMMQMCFLMPSGNILPVQEAYCRLQQAQ
jgi:hypothetical protein